MARSKDSKATGKDKDKANARGKATPKGKGKANVKDTGKAPAATSVAFTGDLDAFLDAVWTLRSQSAIVASYKQAAKQSPEIKRALARHPLIAGDTGPSVRSAIEAEVSVRYLTPLVVADLFGNGYKVHALDALTRWAFDPAAVPALRDAIAATKEPDAKLFIWAAVAASGSDEDRAEAKAHNTKPVRLTTVLARHGDLDAQAMFVAELDRWLELWPTGRRVSSSDFEQIFRIVDAIGDLKMTAAIPALVRACETPLAMRALIALARIGDASGAEAARRTLDDVRGPDELRQYSYVLPAQWLLAALGERMDVTMARAACKGVQPQRYGFPKVNEALMIEACGGEVLVRCGTDADREVLAGWITHRNTWHRDIGRAALAALGRPVPMLEHWDPVRIAEASAGELRAALASPHTVYREEVAKVLGAKGDPAAIAWAVDQLESVENYWVGNVAGAYKEELGAVNEIAVEIVKKNRKAPRVTKSTSAWIQSMLSEQAMPYPVAKPRGIAMTARRLDFAPFVFGQQINGLALDHAGQRLAVVGKELGQIIHARTGECLARLDLRFNWGYDCAFSPDDQLLAVAYHGCHLVVFDAATGVEQRELAWPGGVPHGVKKCAWSPDGSKLAAGGSDGQALVFAWPSGKVLASVKATKRGQGFEAVRWSADGKRCTFSEVSPNTRGTNSLHVLDLGTRKATKIAVPMSVWALRELPDGRTLAGGENKAIVLDASSKPTSVRLPQQGIVRLARVEDGVIALSQTGEVRRWTFTGKKPTSTQLAAASGSAWAMTRAQDGTLYIGGSEGIVQRFAADGTEIAGAGHVHTSHARGFTALSDGTIVTAGWDGRVLRWPATFGTATLIAQRDGRAPEICGQPDRARAYVGVPSGVLVVAVDGATQTIQLAKDEDVEALACDGELLVVATGKDRVVAFTVRDLAEAWSTKLDHEPSAVCFRSDGTILVGTEEGELVSFDRQGNIEWRRYEHRDLSDKLPHGNPHRRVVGLAANGAHWACSSNDDSVRLFSGTVRTRRFLADAGLFNGIAFSPSGHRIAATGSHELQIIDATRGEHLATVPLRACAGADSFTRPYFIADDRLVVGSENGSIFEVAQATSDT